MDVVKLSLREQAILEWVQHRAGVPLGAAAKALHTSESSVRYTIQKLRTAGIIKECRAVDQSTLGLTSYNILIGFQERTAEGHKRFVEILNRQPGVGWAIEVGGEFQYELTLLAKSPSDVATFLSSISKESGTKLSKKVLVLEHHQRYFGLKFGSRTPQEVAEFEIGRTTEYGPVDDLDEKILWSLSHDGNLSSAAISKKLGLPATTVLYRIERLQSKGVISEQLYSIKFSALGLSRTHLLLSCAQCDAAFREKLNTFCRVSPWIYALISSVGAWDFKVVAFTQNTEQLKYTLDQITGNFGYTLANVSVIPCFEPIRMEYFPRATATSRKADAA